MKYTILSLLVFLSLTCQAQRESKILIKFSPYALCDPFFPTIRVGVEFKLSDKLSWYNEAGIKYLDNSFDKDSSFIKSKGFILKSEIRYYFIRNSKSNFDGFYAGVNGFFKQDHYNTQISYYHKQDSLTKRADAFGVKKKVFGINPIMGYQITFLKKFTFDAYCGLGIRSIDVNSVNQAYNKEIDTITHSADVNIPSIIRENDTYVGNRIAPSITLGFRIGVKI
jgi:hypothetical protein